MLVDVVRICGVALGIGGSMYVAPTAFRRYFSMPAGRALRAGRGLLWWRREPVRMHTGAATADWGGMTTELGGVKPTRLRDDVSVGEQLADLRKRDEELQGAIDEVRRDAIERINGLAERQEVDTQDLKQQHASLSRQIDAERRAAETLNVNGFPPIALGIVLTGWPDALLPTPLAGLLLAAAAGITARAVRLWRLPGADPS